MLYMGFLLVRGCFVQHPLSLSDSTLPVLLPSILLSSVRDFIGMLRFSRFMDIFYPDPFL